MLNIEGLTAGYSAIPVLNGDSIKVEHGQFVAIVGPNGAGKTTLFKTISGILRPAPGPSRSRGSTCCRFIPRDAPISASPTFPKDVRFFRRSR